MRRRKGVEEEREQEDDNDNDYSRLYEGNSVFSLILSSGTMTDGNKELALLMPLKGPLSVHPASHLVLSG